MQSLTNAPVIPVGTVELVLMELITTLVLVLHRILENSVKVWQTSVVVCYIALLVKRTCTTVYEREIARLSEQ